MRMTGFLIINPLFGRQMFPVHKNRLFILLAIIMYNTVDVPGQTMEVVCGFMGYNSEFITGLFWFISYTVFNAI